MKKVYRLKGMKDYLLDDMKLWNKILNKIKTIINSYGYKEIKFPIIENKSLFEKTIGNNFNFNKQMYSFEDKNKNILTLRPEGTSVCVRMGIQNGIFRGEKHKFWYFGPMFRHENPQLCRYREFYQLGIESFGYESLGIDIELILLITKIFKSLKIDNFIQLEINSIGSAESREKYKCELTKFFKNKKTLLKENNININKNIFRLFDIKNIYIKELIFNEAPRIINYLDNYYILKLNKFIELLNNNNIYYIHNHFLFRGLDYYNGIVFEWKMNKLSNNLSICAGGRYDELSTNLGSKIIVPSIGLAIGWNRLLFLIKNKLNINLDDNINLYLTLINEDFLKFTIHLSEKIRSFSKKINLFVDYSISNLKNKIRFIKNKNIKISLIILNIKNNNEKIMYKNLNDNIVFIENKNNILNKLKDLFI